MLETFLLSGFGGQGVMFVGQLLAYAAMDKGLEVTWIPSYGPEMRGGTAHCHVVISDKTIGSTSVSKPGTGIIFNIPSWDKYEPLVASGGLLVVNSSLVPDAHTDRTDVTVLNVPAADLADELGNLRLSNVIMMGATLAAHPVLTVAEMRESLNNHIPAHRRGMLDINYKALEKGAEFALKNLVSI